MTEPDRVVFVVDDDASLRESLKDLIRSVGLRVEAFASAQEFLRSKRPDVPGLPGARCAPKGPKRARSAEADGRVRHGDSHHLHHWAR